MGVLMRPGGGVLELGDDGSGGWDSRGGGGRYSKIVLMREGGAIVGVRESRKGCKRVRGLQNGFTGGLVGVTGTDILDISSAMLGG